MITTILKASFARPTLTIVLALAACALGAVWLQDLRRDVFPDLSVPVFNVIVQNPAMGAEELETGIAIPLEVALAGPPKGADILVKFSARRRPVDDRVRAGRRLLSLAPARGRADGTGGNAVP